MDSKRKQILGFGLSTLILVGLIYFADFHRIVGALQQANHILLLPALILGSSVFLVFGFTWYRFLNLLGEDLSYFKSLRLFLAGQFANSVTPFGQAGGEPFMAYVINKNTDMSYERAFCSVLSADIVNTLPPITMTFVGIVYLYTEGALKGVLLKAFTVPLLILVFVTFLVYLLWFKSGSIESLIIKIAEKISEISGRGESKVDGLKSRMENLQQSFELVGDRPYHVLATSILVQVSFLLQVSSLYLVITSITVAPEFIPLFFVMILSSFSNFTPAPGGAGAFEASMAGFLTFFGIASLAESTAIALVFRFTTYWPGILLGYLSLISVGGSK